MAFRHLGKTVEWSAHKQKKKRFSLTIGVLQGAAAAADNHPLYLKH